MESHIWDSMHMGFHAYGIPCIWDLWNPIHKLQPARLYVMYPNICKILFNLYDLILQCDRKHATYTLYNIYTHTKDSMLQMYR